MIPKTVVIGVIFMDIKGFSHHLYAPAGTNPGVVRFVHGGVCRNIAEDMAHIGMPVSFATITDRTPMGQAAIQRLQGEGVLLPHVVTADEGGVGLWLAVMNERGDLAGSISQMPDTRLLEEYLRNKGDEIISSAETIAVEMDAGEAIAEEVTHLATKHGKDLYCVPANLSVVIKRPDLLRQTRCFICNHLEAAKLFGVTLPKESDELLEAVCHEGQHIGLRSMVVTQGTKGCVYYDAATGESGIHPALAAHTVDTTGAGDAFFAGTVSSLTRGLPLGRAVGIGTYLASLTVQSDEAVCPRLPHLWEEQESELITTGKA